MNEYPINDQGAEKDETNNNRTIIHLMRLKSVPRGDAIVIWGIDGRDTQCTVMWEHEVLEFLEQDLITRHGGHLETIAVCLPGDPT